MTADDHIDDPEAFCRYFQDSAWTPPPWQLKVLRAMDAGTVAMSLFGHGEPYYTGGTARIDRYLARRPE